MIQNIKGMTDYYKDKLKEGLEFQDFVFETLYKIGLPLISYSSKKYQVEKGENMSGIEIKFDNKMSKTRNLYIEVAEKSNPNNPNFVPSGIYRTDKTWLYVIGNYEEIFILSKFQLQKLYESNLLSNLKQVQIETSKGFLLPVDYKKGFYIIRHIKCGDTLCLE